MSVAELRRWFAGALEARLSPAALEWYGASARAIAEEVEGAGFERLFALASRHAPRAALAPSAEELAAAERTLAGWNPERWSVLEALRAGLVLARRDLQSLSAREDLEDLFQYADVGELCALYRTLPLLPAPERWAWRAGEGCRSNMKAVFEAVACDNPFPACAFDDVAWRQMVIKAVFVEAPLWRVHGLDGRLSEELARMALDLADERRSAGRPVQPALWLCLGAFGGERALRSLERELDPENEHVAGRRAAAVALARAGAAARLEELLALERDAAVAASMRSALSGGTDQRSFAAFDPTP